MSLRQKNLKKIAKTFTSSSGGKWCKILHSGHILAHKSQLQIAGFFTEIFA
jgi:hypothetical protein